MNERGDRPADRDTIHAEAERIAVPNMDLIVTTIEGIVDAVEALSRRARHHSADAAPHQTGV